LHLAYSHRYRPGQSQTGILDQFVDIAKDQGANLAGFDTGWDSALALAIDAMIALDRYRLV
jgi:hypothetical protein